MAPDTVFARVVAAPSNRSLVESLGPVPVSTFPAAQARAAANLQRELERLEMDPAVAAEIASIDPNGSYAMVLTIEGYLGSSRSKDVTFAGRGRALWERVAWFASECEITNVEFFDLVAFAPEYGGSFALWGKDSVATIDGDRFRGFGDFQSWRRTRDRRRAKSGPKRKGRGRHTYEAGNKIAKAQRSADTRARNTTAKIADLRARANKLSAQGARGLAASLRADAKRIEKRSNAARKRGKGKKK